jgi:putative ABC transport system permease protein
VWIGGSIGNASIVGLVGNVRHRSLAIAPRAELYVPFRQYPHGGMTLVVRGAGDPALLARTVKDEVYALDANQPLSDIVTLPHLLADSLSPQRFSLMLLGGFAVLAVLLAAVGVYGIIAYAVGQRTHEIGIRMALGAASREIRWAVIRPAVGLAALGVTAGSAAAWMLGDALARDLYETSPHDPLIFAGVAAILLSAAWAACAVPALRASRTDPMTCLRPE